jgi:hypothetical protein
MPGGGDDDSDLLSLPDWDPDEVPVRVDDADL